MKRAVKFVYSSMYQNNNVTFFEKLIISITTLCVLFLVIIYSTI
jgi:hypothetical protein